MIRLTVMFVQNLCGTGRNCLFFPVCVSNVNFFGSRLSFGFFLCSRKYIEILMNFDISDENLCKLKSVTGNLL